MITENHGDGHGEPQQEARFARDKWAIAAKPALKSETDSSGTPEAEPPPGGSKIRPRQPDHGATVAAAPLPAPFYDERSLHALALERARREVQSRSSALFRALFPKEREHLPRTPAGRIAFVSALLAPGHASTCECEDCEEEGDGVPELLEPLITPEQARALLDIPDFGVRS